MLRDALFKNVSGETPKTHRGVKESAGQPASQAEASPRSLRRGIFGGCLGRKAQKQYAERIKVVEVFILRERCRGQNYTRRVFGGVSWVEETAPDLITENEMANAFRREEPRLIRPSPLEDKPPTQEVISD